MSWSANTDLIRQAKEQSYPWTNKNVVEIGKYNNTHTVQPESSKFESVSFDQGFQIWVGTDQNAISRYFASIQLYLALLFIMSIQEIGNNLLPREFEM